MGLIEPDEGRVLGWDELDEFGGGSRGCRSSRLSWGASPRTWTLFADASRVDLDAAASITDSMRFSPGCPTATTRCWVHGVGLSAGQRQRLALTRVLVSTGSLLLLDEPTAHLDPTSAERVPIRLRERAVGGDAVVVVAHGAECCATPTRSSRCRRPSMRTSFDADPLVRRAAVFSA